MGTKEGSGGKEVMEEEALTGAEGVELTIWCFRKGVDWFLRQCN